MENEKWVGFLSSEEANCFYGNDLGQMYAHSSDSTHCDGADTKSASSSLSESTRGIGEEKSQTKSAIQAATEAQKESGTKSANSKVLGMAVIRDAIVVNSTAYLQVSYVLHNWHRIEFEGIC